MEYKERKKKVMRFGTSSQHTMLTEVYSRLDVLLPVFSKLTEVQQEDMINQYYMYYNNALERADELYKTEIKKKNYASATDAVLGEMFYFLYVTTVLVMRYTGSCAMLTTDHGIAHRFFKKVEALRYAKYLRSLVNNNRNKYNQLFLRKIKNTKINRAID